MLAGQKGGIKFKWRPYLENVAFQTIVLKKLFPTARITPYLRLPDESESTTLDLIFDDFKLAPPDSPPLSRFRKPTVDFIGDEIGFGGVIIGCLRAALHFFHDQRHA